eukprot:UC4_evm1s1105
MEEPYYSQEDNGNINTTSPYFSSPYNFKPPIPLLELLASFRDGLDLVVVAGSAYGLATARLPSSSHLTANSFIVELSKRSGDGQTSTCAYDSDFSYAWTQRSESLSSTEGGADDDGVGSITEASNTLAGIGLDEKRASYEAFLKSQIRPGMLIEVTAQSSNVGQLAVGRVESVSVPVSSFGGDLEGILSVTYGIVGNLEKITVPLSSEKIHPCGWSAQVQRYIFLGNSDSWGESSIVREKRVGKHGGLTVEDYEDFMDTNHLQHLGMVPANFWSCFWCQYSISRASASSSNPKVRQRIIDLETGKSLTLFLNNFN